MSLWSKAIEQYTYDDIAAFCAGKVPEGLGVEYKRDWPNDLGKPIAAFANTRGGIILLGVETDRPTNKPLDVPSCMVGVAAGNGHDRIEAIATGLYPEAPIEIGGPYPIPTAAGRELYLVRVRESESAPHSSPDRTRFYVRRESSSAPHVAGPWTNDAMADDLERMYSRRKRWDEERREIRRKAHARTRPMVNPATGQKIYLWMSFLPLCPSEQMFSDPNRCVQLHSRIYGDDVQAAPRGSLLFQRPSGSNSGAWRYGEITVHGHVYGRKGLLVGNNTLIERDLHVAVNEMTELAQSVYRAADRHRPSSVTLAMGCVGIGGLTVCLESGERPERHLSFDDAFEDEFYINTDIEPRELYDKRIGPWLRHCLGCYIPPTPPA